MAKEGLFKIKDNLTTYDRTILAASEFVGTAILVIIGCMGCVSFGQTSNHLSVSICFGLGITIAVQCVAHISGSHINPAVTIASALLGNTPLVQIPFYFIGQFLGAIAGYGVLKIATPAQFLNAYNGTEKLTGVCSPAISSNVTVLNGFAAEFFATLILILLCCGIWDPRNSTKHDSVPVKFGLAVTALAIAAGPYSGANLNPARSFAPALWNGDWDNHWVYWVGPTLGSVVGAVFYRLLFSVQIRDEKQCTPETIPLNDKP